MQIKRNLKKLVLASNESKNSNWTGDCPLSFSFISDYGINPKMLGGHPLARRKQF